MATEDAEPLMPEGSAGRPSVEEEVSLEQPHEEPDEPSNARPGRFTWILTFSAALSGLLFGYDTGVMSSALISIHNDLSSQPLSTLDKSLITSITSLTAFLASPLAGPLADSIGRKRAVLVSDALFVVGALWQALAARVASMVAGRAVVGLAIGVASFLTPLYIGETAPAAWRGRLVTVAPLCITAGQVIAYLVGWALAGVQGGWRAMVGLGALPAIAQIVCLLLMPESPRWLVKVGRGEEAKGVLERVYGRGKERRVEGVLKGIEMEVQEEDRVMDVGRERGFIAGLKRVRSTFLELFTVGGNRRALTIACMLQGAQQLCGFNSLMYFSATIFAMIGFRNPTGTALLIATTNFLFTLVAFQAIDRIGRRRILLISIPIMALGLLLASFSFYFIKLGSGWGQQAANNGKFFPVLLVVSLLVFVAAYALGLGNVPWQQSELFPLRVRAAGSGVATATNWASNALVAFTFLPLVTAISPAWTFAMYALVCVAAWVAVGFMYPETAGLGLEEVGGLLRSGWGVRESVRMFAGRK